MSDCGFEWGPLVVERTMQIERKTGTSRVLHLTTPFGRYEVYVSPTGRSVRFFHDGKELR